MDGGSENQDCCPTTQDLYQGAHRGPEVLRPASLRQGRPEDEGCFPGRLIAAYDEQAAVAAVVVLVPLELRVVLVSLVEIIILPKVLNLSSLVVVVEH